MMRSFALAFFTTATLVAEPAFVLRKSDAKLSSPAVTEASGIASSPSADDFLWMVNDSGGTPEIHLSTADGTPRGAVDVADAVNTDWEDLAAFTLDGEPHLLIADTGDNAAAREICTLYILREPTLPAAGKILSGKSPILWKITFTYEDGPRDCEAVAVDADHAKIILISKRTDPPRMYELPLRPAENAVARKIGITAVKAPGLISFPFANQPTGLDLSTCHLMAAIVTYHGVFLFRRDDSETWAEAFAKKPESLGAHRLAQAESVAFSRDGKSIFAVSEKVNSPIAHYGTPD